VVVEVPARAAISERVMRPDGTLDAVDALDALDALDDFIAKLAIRK
jgi:hypothetical protein